jgi:hypothetical protein
MRLQLFLISLLTGVTTHAACEFSTVPETRSDTSTVRFLIWSNESPALLTQTEVSSATAYQSYRDTVTEKVDPDPIALIQRQREIFRRFYPQGVTRFDDILNGRLGEVLPITCLESLLFAEHTARYPVESTGSEFVGIILKQPQTERLKVLLLSGFSGTPGVTPSGLKLIPQLEADLKAGWIEAAHVHNHPFSFHQEDIAGTPVPSGNAQVADGSLYLHHQRAYGLQEGWVTNGFSTLRIPARQFSRFHNY